MLGGVTGLLIGSLYDLDESDATESALGDISRTVRPGKTALLAEADEQSPDVVDNAMTSLGGRYCAGRSTTCKRRLPLSRRLSERPGTASQGRCSSGERR